MGTSLLLLGIAILFTALHLWLDRRDGGANARAELDDKDEP